MRPGPSLAAQFVISEFDIVRQPVSAHTLLIEIAVSKAWFPNLTPDEVIAKCDGWAEKFLAFLVDELNERRTDGRHSRYDFNSSTETLVQGSCFVEPNDSPELKNAKEARAQHGRYAEFLRSISPRDFEAVCKGVISLFGCNRPVLTRASNDQGIDFHGHLSLKGKMGQDYLLPSVDKNFSAWLVGQAKHYGGTASTPELRELAGSVALARAGVSADDGSALASLKIRVFDPVFYLFLTTGDLSADSRRLGKRSGIIVMDGESIAAFLADNKVGILNEVFDDLAARAWIDNLLNSTTQNAATGGTL